MKRVGRVRKALVRDPSTCPHDEIYAGLCCECCVPVSDAARVRLSSNMSVAPYAAENYRSRSTELLLASKKLALVVDLDETLVHTTTHAEKVKNKKCHSFKLSERSRTTYYLRERPGLCEFLHSAKEKYELYLYTLGKRSYARKALEIIDPGDVFFERRLFAFEDAPDTTGPQGTLPRLKTLFPQIGSEALIVIIDDRPAVWTESPNLLPILPCAHAPRVLLTL